MTGTVARRGRPRSGCTPRPPTSGGRRGSRRTASRTFAQVRVARVELREVGHEMGRRVAFPGGEALHASEELGVGEACESGKDVVVHVPLVARTLDSTLRTRQAALGCPRPDAGSPKASTRRPRPP